MNKADDGQQTGITGALTTAKLHAPRPEPPPSSFWTPQYLDRKIQLLQGMTTLGSQGYLSVV